MKTAVSVSATGRIRNNQQIILDGLSWDAEDPESKHERHSRKRTWNIFKQLPDGSFPQTYQVSAQSPAEQARKVGTVYLRANLDPEDN